MINFVQKEDKISFHSFSKLKRIQISTCKLECNLTHQQYEYHVTCNWHSFDIKTHKEINHIALPFIFQFQAKDVVFRSVTTADGYVVIFGIFWKTNLWNASPGFRLNALRYFTIAEEILGDPQTDNLLSTRYWKRFEKKKRNYIIFLFFILMIMLV